MPIFSKGYNTHPLTFDPGALSQDFDVAAWASLEAAWNETPFQSIYRMSSINAAAKRTGGVTGLQDTDDINEAYEKVVDLPSLTNPVSLLRWMAQDTKQTDPTQSPYWISRDEADRIARERGFSADALGISDRGASSIVLDIVLDAKNNERLRNMTIDQYSGGFVGSASLFGIGMVTQMADPINVAMSFVPVIGQAKYASSLKAATSTAGRSLIRARNGFIEGAVGAAMIEPIVLIASHQEQLDYGMVDSMLNIGFGAMIGAGLHAGAGALGDALSSRSTKAQAAKDIERIIAEAQVRGSTARRISNAGPDTRNHAAMAAVADTEYGRNVTTPDQVMMRDPAYRSVAEPEIDGMPDVVRFAVDEKGSVSVVRKPDALDHVVASDRPRHVDATLADQPGVSAVDRAISKLDATVKALDSKITSPSGIPYSLGDKTIVNAIDEIGGIKGKSQLGQSKAAQDERLMYADLPRQYQRDLLKGDGGLSLNDMAVRLKEQYGIGDGTIATMKTLMHADIDERLALASSLDVLKEQHNMLIGGTGALLDRMNASTPFESAARNIQRQELVDDIETIGFISESDQYAEDASFAYNTQDAVDYARHADDLQNKYLYDTNEGQKIDATAVAEDVLTPDRLPTELEQLEQELAEIAQNSEYLAGILDEVNTMTEKEMAIATSYERMAACVLGR